MERSPEWTWADLNKSLLGNQVSPMAHGAEILRADPDIAGSTM